MKVSLKRKLCLSGMAAFSLWSFQGCGDYGSSTSDTPKVVLSANKTSVVVGESIEFDASQSVGDQFAWTLNGETTRDCDQLTTCVFTMNTVGSFEVGVTASIQKQSESSSLVVQVTAASTSKTNGATSNSVSATESAASSAQGTCNSCTWGTAQLIETDNAGSASSPQIAMGSDGKALAVWYQNDGARINIWSNRFDGTSWGTAQLIETDNAGDAYSQQIVMGSDGKALAVWTQSDGTHGNIWSNRFDGTSWSTAQLLETDNAGNAASPQIAIGSDGKALAIWYQSDGTRHNIWSNRFDGISWGTAQLLETDNAGNAVYPEIAIGSDGKALAVWYQTDGIRNNIWSNRFDGISWGTAQLLETDNAGNAASPQIAIGSDGKALAVWYQTDGTRNNIWSNRFDGTSWGTAQLIETDNAGTADYPQIAISSDGKALAVWQQNDGTRVNIYSNRFDGASWGTAQLIETVTGTANMPQIAIGSDGKALAVWHQTNGVYNIWSNRFDGTSWGTAQLIETDNAGNAQFPQITIGSDGKSLAVWQQNDGTRVNIWSNRFQ